MDIVELVRRYEPVLRFSRDGKDREENFFPMAATDYVAEAALFRRGQGPLKERGQLTAADLAALNPLEARELYLTFAADEVLSQNPSLANRLAHGGLALFGVAGEVQPQLVVEDEAGAAFALADPGLERVEPGVEARGELDDLDDLEMGDLAFSQSDELDSLEGTIGAEESFLISDAMQLPGQIRTKALARYAPYRDFAARPPIYHYRTVFSRGYLVLQYYFFYAYNDWGSAHEGFNDHEGDWEMISLYLRGDEPLYTAYSAHTGGPEVHAWDDADLEKVDGTHPVVYVGCGSHAGYYQAGTHKMFQYVDISLGNSAVSIGPQTDVAWGEPLDLGTQLWALNYSGGWGAMVRRFGAGFLAAGAQAPLGPPWQFQRWETPVGWAGGRVPF